MKKNITTITAGIFFLLVQSFGQSTDIHHANNAHGQRKVETYFDLMINMASTHINYGKDNRSLAGYKKSTRGLQAGVSLQRGISSNFSLVTELYYIRKGGKLKENNPLTQAPSTIRLHSLELPVLARLHLGRFYVNAGPSIAWNLGGYQSIDGKFTRFSFGNDAGSIAHFEGAMQMGGGIQFPFKQKRLAIDLRYNHGLTNISRQQEMYNRGIMISVRISKALQSKS